MGDQVPDWITSNEVSGIIARVDAHNYEPLQALGLPIVDVLCSRPELAFPRIETDDALVARIAFDHLYECGFRYFAFAGYRGAHYSEARLQHFRNRALEHDCTLEVYETASDRRDTLFEVERTGAFDSESLGNWLRGLRKPIGLMACHDIRGQQIMNACRSLGISVPDEIGVIGVDDDDTICPLSDPPLSSVRPDAETVGFVAAETLESIMNGGDSNSKIRHVPPTRIVRRESTEVFAVEDRELAQVCRFIRLNACRGIDVSDVVEFSNLSRRQLERRFRTELDRTPREEITNVRIRRIKELLIETDLPLERIAALVGFSNTENVSVIFKRETGQTPGSFRNATRDSR